MSGIGGQILSWTRCRKSHRDSAGGAVEVYLTSPRTQRQMLRESPQTPGNSSGGSAVDGCNVGRNNIFPFSSQLPPTPRHSLNDPHVQVQSVRGRHLRSCAIEFCTGVRGSAKHKIFPAEEHTVVSCTTPAPKTNRHECPEDSLRLGLATADRRKAADIWSPAHKIHFTGNSSHGEQMRTSKSTPGSRTIPSVSHGWSARQPKSWSIASPSGEHHQSVVRQRHLQGVSRFSSPRVCGSDRVVGGCEAAKGSFQCEVRHNSSSPAAISQEEVPPVAQILLHERIESDLERLLQELLHSPTGLLDLQRALHAGVERGLLRRVSCTSTDVAAATADDPLLRGFCGVRCSGGHAEALTYEVHPSHLLQQLWRQRRPQPHHTREVRPQEEGNESAHIRAHNRPEGLHLCRILGSNGELVHVPYTPYQQNITRGSSPLAREK